MRQRGELRLWTGQELDAGESATLSPDEHTVLQTILAWSREYLIKPHEQLGREGPVCPYVKKSMATGGYFLAAPVHGINIALCREAIWAYCEWYLDMASQLAPADARLLAIIVPYPDFDRTTSTPLDEFQDTLKSGFVDRGLMIGEFHPLCESPGLWNHEFRPLRSPAPILVIRQMVPFDLPFLMEEPSHFTAYLRKFAAQIPNQMRVKIVNKAFTPAAEADADS
jgi:hypothetical protein